MEVIPVMEKMTICLQTKKIREYINQSIYQFFILLCRVLWSCQKLINWRQHLFIEGPTLCFCFSFDFLYSLKWKMWLTYLCTIRSHFLNKKVIALLVVTVCTRAMPVTTYLYAKNSCFSFNIDSIHILQSVIHTHPSLTIHTRKETIDKFARQGWLTAVQSCNFTICPLYVYKV